MSHQESRDDLQTGSEYGRLIAAILLFCLLAAAGYALKHTISCFLLSWVIAYLLDPLIVQAERLGAGRNYALGMLYVLMGIVSVFSIAYIIPAITISWNNFILDIPSYIQKMQQLVTNWKDELPYQFGRGEIQWLLDKASGNIGKAAEFAGLWLYSFGTGFIFNLFNIILSPILVFFMLYYKHTVVNTFTSWLPEGKRPLFMQIGREVNRSIGGYLRGQVAVSVLVAILVTLTLFIIDVPHPVFCGIFAGAASILPFIGVVIALIPALFFAWFKFQTAAVIWQTLSAFALIYFIEGYLIKPLVFKESMNLNPLVTIIMVMALGETLGFWGIMLALPIASAIKITWGHFVNGEFNTGR